MTDWHNRLEHFHSRCIAGSKEWVQPPLRGWALLFCIPTQDLRPGLFSAAPAGLKAAKPKRYTPSMKTVYSIFKNGVARRGTLQDKPQRLKPYDSTAVTAWLQSLCDNQELRTSGAKAPLILRHLRHD